jgi:hypothetical protein
MLGLRNFEADVRRKSSLNTLRTRVWERTELALSFDQKDRLLLDLIILKIKYQDNKKNSQKAYHGHKLMFSSKAQLQFYSTILNNSIYKVANMVKC